MSIFERMKNLIAQKAQTSVAKWQSSTMFVVSGGSKGEGKRQTFSPYAAAMSYRSWVYAAANLNAVAVASVPLCLYVRNRSTGTKLWKTKSPSRRTKAYLSGDRDQRPSNYVLRKAAEYGSDFEKVTDTHPILELLAKVNPYQNGYDATVLRVLYTELTGNAYIHPVLDPTTKRPVQLWTMPSQFVEIVPGKEKFLDGYLYGASREQRKIFEADEVIHFKRPNPNDLYYGIGKVEAAWSAVQMNAAVHEMDLSFFENKARPDYLMTIRGDASQDEIERLEAQIDEKLRGSRRTGRFLTATADIDIKPLSFPPKDLAGRESIVEEIAAIFGVPVSMLKANDPNLASAQIGYSMWRESTILPMLRMDEEVLNQNLLPLFGIEDDAFLAYDNPVVEDRRLELEEIRTAVSGGWMTVNEARAIEGMEPLDDEFADRALMNGQPLGGVAAQNSPVGVAPEEIPTEEISQSSDDQSQSVGLESGTPIANTALNGAQISSLVKLVTDAQAGLLPIESARLISGAAFSGIPASVIDSIFRSVSPAKSPDGLVGPLDTAPDLEEPPERQPERKDALSDCVSEKVAKLITEGYPQDQAVAIAYSMCSEGKSIEEAASSLGLATKAFDVDDVDTKALGDIDTTPPKSVAENARRALEVRASKPESQRGMTAVGIARARDLSNRKPLSEDTIRRMLSYFERHEVDKQGSTWDEQGRGWQAWYGWGGDDGFAWSRRKVDEFNRERERKKKSCGCCAKNGGGDPPAKPSERISGSDGHPKKPEKKKSIRQSDLWNDLPEIAVPDRIRRKASRDDAKREMERILEEEEEIGRSVDRVLRRQVDAVLKELRASTAPTAELTVKVEEILRSSKWDRQLVEALRPYLLSSLENGIAVGVDAVKEVAKAAPDFWPSREELEAYTRSESVRLARGAARGVNRYTVVRFSEIIGTGVQDGKTIPEIASDVQEWAGEKGDAKRATRSRALMIARTEAQRASRKAEVEAWKATGIVEGKVWLLAPDPCEFCEAASDAFSANQIGLEDSFYQKGDLLFGTPDAEGNRREMLIDYEDIEGPPLHPNCRCSLQPRLISDYEEIIESGREEVAQLGAFEEPDEETE